MMQRRIRQHDAEIGRAVRHVPGNVGSGPGAKKNNRRGRRLEQLHFGRRDLAVFSRHSKRRHHQRERLLFPMLALAQARYRIPVASIHQKLESSNPFQGDDFALQQRFDRIFDSAIEFRPAHRAGIRLRVKAAVGGILIFFPARRA
jgi:hypothetical protein